MNIQRVNEILKKKEKCDVYYGDKLVWIQKTNGGKFATVGFIDGTEDKTVNINDLYEPSI